MSLQNSQVSEGPLSGAGESPRPFLFGGMKMITLYTGTPGSGKSLHSAQVIRDNLIWAHRNVIANFPVDMRYVWYTNRQLKQMEKDSKYEPKKRKTSRFYYIDDLYLTPDFLYAYAKKFHEPRKESQTLVVIDECQADWLFGNRSWQNKMRPAWCRLFQVHRHLGFDFILMAQSDKLIDKAIRCEIEYEVKHRKISNFGMKGKLIGLLIGGCAFVAVKVWYGIGQKVDSHFFRYRKMYSKFYDSYRDFSKLGGAKNAGS